jgi:hypothetical protein
MRARNVRFREACHACSGWRRIDAAPAAVAPGQVPARVRWFHGRNIVDARRAPGLTAQQPRQRHPSAAPQAETLDCFVGIDRAGRQMPAVVADQQRKRVPIESDQAAPGIARQAQDRARTIRAKVCSLHGRSAVIFTVVLRGFQCTEPLSCRYLRHSCKISHVRHGTAAKVLWTTPVSTVTVLITRP